MSKRKSAAEPATRALRSKGVAVGQLVEAKFEGLRKWTGRVEEDVRLDE